MAWSGFRGTFFELLYPRDWECEIIEDIPCFFDPEGGGAVQIAAFRHPENKNFDFDQEMQRYLEGHEIRMDKSRIAEFNLPSGLACRACEFVLENRFWLVNMIVQGSRMILVIYNADEIPDQETVQKITGMIHTIRMETGVA
ncbi:MAG: hypothetical protein KDK37_16675 [Leptospiraceae bacterium]|nr:hypothetical protein [Leptospiraceae bacterium]MCB1305926.1 hypothetical protein [Leptospiraceae bacterium]